jgi:hypothetical protein
MLTDLILVSITLASTIVGTLLNPKPSVKLGIILLACAATAATLFKAYDDHLDKEFIKTALAAQLATATPTAEFKRALGQSLDRVAKKHGLEGNGSIEKDEGTLYFFSQPQSGISTGAITLSLEDRGQAFVRYAAKRPLDDVLEAALFKIPDVKSEVALQKVLDEFAFVGAIAIGETAPLANSSLTTTTRLSPNGVTVTATAGRRKVEVKLEKDFIDTIISLAPVERNWKAYEEFEKQLKAAK